MNFNTDQLISTWLHSLDNMLEVLHHHQNTEVVQWGTEQEVVVQWGIEQGVVVQWGTEQEVVQRGTVVLQYNKGLRVAENRPWDMSQRGRHIVQSG